MQYKHLNIEEREKIQEMRWGKQSIRSMAQTLNRSPSSISRELKRSFPPQNKVYVPRIAHERALRKRKSRGRIQRLKNNLVREYVIKYLKLGWSPEQISGTIKKSIGETISHEAIYQYVYAQIYQGGHGLLKPGCEDLRPYLSRRRKRRIRKGLRSTYRIDKGPLPCISERPLEVEARKRVGHWEDDLIISKQSTDNLKTINERVSGLVFISRVKDGTIAETNRAISERMRAIPTLFRRTLTRDRGSENLGYQELKKKLNINCYFAHAYHSWERGSNENLNGLIRRYFPKKTDFKKISDQQIQTVEYLLNSRPRKRLGWKTPYQVFYEKTGVALQY